MSTLLCVIFGAVSWVKAGAPELSPVAANPKKIAGLNSQYEREKHNQNEIIVTIYFEWE